MKKKVVGALFGASLMVTAFFGFQSNNANAQEILPGEVCFTQGYWDHVSDGEGNRRAVLFCLGSGPEICVVPAPSCP